MGIKVNAGTDGKWLGDFSPTGQIPPHNIPKSAKNDFASASSFMPRRSQIISCFMSWVEVPPTATHLHHYCWLLEHHLKSWLRLQSERVCDATGRRSRSEACHSRRRPWFGDLKPIAYILQCTGFPNCLKCNEASVQCELYTRLRKADTVR